MGRRIFTSFAGKVDNVQNFQFVILTLTFYQGQGHTIVKTEKQKVRLVQSAYKIPKFYLLHLKICYVLHYVLFFYNSKPKITGIMVKNIRLP